MEGAGRIQAVPGEPTSARPECQGRLIAPLGSLLRCKSLAINLLALCVCLFFFLFKVCVWWRQGALYPGCFLIK